MSSPESQVPREFASPPPPAPPTPPVASVPVPPVASAPVPPAPVYGATTPPASGYPAPGYPAPGHPAPGYPAPGYPASGYPAPAYPAPGYPAPGYPAPGYAAAVPPRGLLPWILGFLIVIPFPFVGGIASGIAMAVSGGASRRAGGVARENARAALNWGLTYLMVSTLLLILHFVMLFILTSDSPATGFYPLGIPITLYFAVSIMHLVIVIVGTVRASSGRAMRVPFAIPFLRG